MISKVHNFEGELVSLTIVAMEKEINNFSVIIATFAMSKDCLVKSLKLIDLDYHGQGSVQIAIKCRNLKNLHFEKNGAKDKNITILFFMSTFHNFAHKMKTC